MLKDNRTLQTHYPRIGWNKGTVGMVAGRIVTTPHFKLLHVFLTRSNYSEQTILSGSTKSKQSFEYSHCQWILNQKLYKNVLTKLIFREILNVVWTNTCVLWKKLKVVWLHEISSVFYWNRLRFLRYSCTTCSYKG